MLRREQSRNIDLIKAEVQAMIDSCNIQKNVNMTIKDGLKKINMLIAAIDRNQISATEKEDRYQKGLVITEEDRQERKQIRERVQAQVMRNVVLASNEVSKRKRPPQEEESPDNRPFEKAVLGHKPKASGRTPAQKKLIEDKAPAMPSKNKKMISSVLIKVGQGKSYADVLGKLRKEVNTDASGSRVVSARATQKGDVLIVLDRASNKEGFTAEVRRVDEGLGEVRADPKKVTLKIRDLDPLATEEEVKAELRKTLRNEQTNLKVKVFDPNRRGLKLAVVVLPEDEAIKLEELSRLKVGMTSCRVRRRVVVTRCFRCLGFGHQRRSCKEEDRSSLCYKCGEAGHPAKSCTGMQKCFLCVKEDPAVDCGHVAGSGACAAFRRALESEKKKERWKPPKRK